MTTLVENAKKVVGFRLQIINACKRNGVSIPSDEKISEYINQGFGMNVANFMHDYTNNKGVFKSPLMEFAEKVWATCKKGEQCPTLEELAQWGESHDYNVDAYLLGRKIDAYYKGLERNTLIETLNKLDDVWLVCLWNKFVESSMKVGEDSHIYDMACPRELSALINYAKDDFGKLGEFVLDNINNVRFFQYIEGVYIPKIDIKGTIICFWGDIFEDIMKFPSVYQSFECNGDVLKYFFPTIFPLISGELGYECEE